MGPKIKQLFRDRKDAPYPLCTKAAGELRQLFSDHGEALIAAMEDARVVLNHITVEENGVRYNAYKSGCVLHPDVQKCIVKLTDLSAQLEAEAQP